MNRHEGTQLTALFLMAALSPSVAQAQVITLQRAEIAASVEKGMECYIHPDGPDCPPLSSIECFIHPDGPDCPSKPDCNLKWAYKTPGFAKRVRVSRLNSKTIKADVHMKCRINAFTDPDVYIRLDLAFSCSLPPRVRVSPANVDVDVNWPGWLDAATASVTWWIGNIASRTATSKVSASGALKTFVQERMVPLNYCPGIAVQSNGDVEFNLAMGTECTNGQTNHRRCPANHTGPGLDSVCVGGRWASAGGWCEPKPPPGGQPL
jgi:hypothetical protein